MADTEKPPVNAEADNAAEAEPAADKDAAAAPDSAEVKKEVAAEQKSEEKPAEAAAEQKDATADAPAETAAAKDVPAPAAEAKPEPAPEAKPSVEENKAADVEAAVISTQDTSKPKDKKEDETAAAANGVPSEKDKGKEAEAPKEDDNTILLYTFPRKAIRNIIPSISPPVLKTETWLRLKKLPYKTTEVSKGAKSTGLLPYARYKGQEIVDSNIIIRELSQKFEIDPNEGLSDSERAVGRAFLKMVEENTYWTWIWHKYFNTSPNALQKTHEVGGPKFANGIVLKLEKRKIGGRLKGQGIGLLPKDEILQIVKDDLTALSTFLGDKQFMLGDNPTVLDCSVFGLLCQFLYVDVPTPHKEFVEQNCSNFMPYLDRIKSLAWPDWDEICTGKVLP